MTSYNEVILSQEYRVCFQIVEEEKNKANIYGGTGRTTTNYLTSS